MRLLHTSPVSVSMQYVTVSLARTSMYRPTAGDVALAGCACWEENSHAPTQSATAVGRAHRVVLVFLFIFFSFVLAQLPGLWFVRRRPGETLCGAGLRRRFTLFNRKSGEVLHPLRPSCSIGRIREPAPRRRATGHLAKCGDGGGGAGGSRRPKTKPPGPSQTRDPAGVESPDGQNSDGAEKGRGGVLTAFPNVNENARQTV